MQNLIVFLLVLSHFSLTSAAGIQYVLPSISPHEDCSGHPCLSLDHYIAESSKYFTTGSIFVFLPGNHSLRTSLNITDVYDISFSNLNSSPYPTILCTDKFIAENVTGFNIEGILFVFESNTSAFLFSNSQGVAITNSSFRTVSTGNSLRAILFSNSRNITIIGCLFEENIAGAIVAQQGTTMTLIRNDFIRNRASAILAITSSKIWLSGNNFSHNLGYDNGGAINCDKCTITMTDDHNIFHNNSVVGSLGGAIAVSRGKLTATGSASFTENKARNGGAISLSSAYAEFINVAVTFEDNVAKYVGGGMYSTYSSIKSDNQNFTFVSNTAEGVGKTEVCGVLCVFNTVGKSMENKMSATLLRNTGTSGGAVYFEKADSGISFNDIYAKGNVDSAIGVIEATVDVVGTNVFSNNRKGAINIIGNSTVIFRGYHTFTDHHGNLGPIRLHNGSQLMFSGSTKILNNVAKSGGGGIVSIESSLILTGDIVIGNNGGNLGGGMYTERGTVNIKNTFLRFTNNTAITSGGGLYASGTRFTCGDGCTVVFSQNSAECGGAMYLLSDTFIYLELYASLITSDNHATLYGGAIYHNDSIRIVQCTSVTSKQPSWSALPKSFLQLKTDPALNASCPTIYSQNNSAGKDGNFLYGGLLDRSSLENIPDFLPLKYFTTICAFNVSSQISTKNDITSSPFQLSFCNTKFENNISVHRGQTFKLLIEALGQGKSQVPTTVTALTSSTARLKINQNSQSISRTCTELTYNLFSPENQEILTIYPDGPCQAIGSANTSIKVTLLPCPHGFTQSNETCVCEDRLNGYDITCTIDNKILMIRNEGARFWVNSSYENGSYAGLILSSSCPIEYCKTDVVKFELNDSDSLCASNHSGVLCGKCATNKSLLLGSSQCGTCSNIYLILLVPFAMAGVALIVFLSLSKLTVAAGTINCVILYANIVQANKGIFLPLSSNRTNPLTVFIAWMNLDLGFETCFFNGMDVYTQTFLQFVFSAYVWTLIIFIIVISRYSITVSKFIGSNPVAVLATLLLMSYNKILKIIIDVFSPAVLEYPDEKHVTVWLKDGSLQFFQSKHLILSIFTILVLIFFFLPYTVLLLLGHLLFRLHYRQHCHWLIMRIKPLLDSYYAPFKAKSRYWTGFLLLVRCCLYIIFSFNSIGWTYYSLLAIIISFSSVGSLLWLQKGIYQHFYVDVIEVSVYLNLIALSAAAATLPKATSIETMSNVLIGIVFVMATGILIHRIHISYVANSRLWLKIKLKMSHHRPKLDAQMEQPIPSVSRTDVCLREPLMDSN